LGRGTQPAQVGTGRTVAAEAGGEALDVRFGVAGFGQDRGLHLEHAALGEERAHQRVQPRAQAQRLDLRAGAPVVRAHACSARKACKRASSHTSMPSSPALASLEPAASPATTKLVFFDTLPATLAPSASSFSLASSRLIAARVPVSTTVLPSSGPAPCPAWCGTRASSSAWACALRSNSAALASCSSHATRALALSAGRPAVTRACTGASSSAWASAKAAASCA